MITVTIHQPMYLPYPGVFNKIKESDIFVYLDDADYSSGYFFNRNRIKGPNGIVMLTVPVMKKTGTPLNEIEIAQNIHWQDKHWKSLSMYYASSTFFNDYKDFFKNFYSKKWKKLHELNMESMNFLISELGIDVPCYLSSELLKESNLTGTQRLVELCKKVGASRYLSGVSGRDYIDEGLFEKEGIGLIFPDYKPREYTQRFPPFIPNLSVVDLLFNMGEKSRDFI